MSFAYYTERQQLALEALAEYRFLTVKQMVRLKIGKSETSIRDNILAPLYSRYRAPINKQDVGKFLGASYVWSLTAKGARDLAEFWEVPEDKVPFPKGGVQFSTQYWHRIAQIDFHIAVNQWAETIGAEIVLKARDYIKTLENNRAPETKIIFDDGNFIIPDGVFGIRFQGKLFLYALEIHHADSTERITAKLKNYFKALVEKKISERWNYDLACYVLSVYQEQDLCTDTKLTRSQRQSKNLEFCRNKMEYVKQRLLSDSEFERFKPGFYFNSMDQVRSDLTTGWTLADDIAVTPF